MLEVFEFIARVFLGFLRLFEALEALAHIGAGLKWLFSSGYREEVRNGPREAKWDALLGGILLFGLLAVVALLIWIIIR